MATTAQETTETQVATTYLQLISKDEKQIKQEGLAIKAQEAHIEVQKEIMALRSAIAQKTAQVEASKRKIPYDVKVEYKLTNELAELNARLEFAQTIKTERFSDATI